MERTSYRVSDSISICPMTQAINNKQPRYTPDASYFIIFWRDMTGVLSLFFFFYLGSNSVKLVREQTTDHSIYRRLAKHGCVRCAGRNYYFETFASQSALSLAPLVLVKERKMKPRARARAFVTVPLSAATLRAGMNWTVFERVTPDSTSHEKCIRRIPASRRRRDGSKLTSRLCATARYRFH